MYAMFILAEFYGDTYTGVCVFTAVVHFTDRWPMFVTHFRAEGPQILQLSVMCPMLKHLYVFDCVLN